MEIKEPIINDNVYDIDSFGVLGDDPFYNQKVLQQAINQVAEDGGGRINLREGIYPMGPIEFKSNIWLHIPRNCYLKFVKNSEFYKVKMFNYEGIDCLRCNSPIEIHYCKNVKITGEGILDGCGDLWRPIKKWKVTDKKYEQLLKISPFVIKDKETEIWYPSETSYKGALNKNDNLSIEDANLIYDYFRPVFISIYYSENVLFEGITSTNSPAWNIHPLFSHDLIFSNIKVKNDYHAQNGDGIDIESCKAVEVKDSLFEVGDDGICIKSGKNKKAREIKAPSENIYIHDSIVYHAHGGIVIGSEMSRGVRNIECANCTFVGTDIGIRFKSAIGRGGVVENIKIHHINMVNILEEAMIFNMDYSLYKMSHQDSDDVKTYDSSDIPLFKQIYIDNINCDSAKVAVKMLGINPKTIKEIVISNSKINALKGLDLKNCSDIEFKNVLLNISGKLEEILYKKVEEC